jgi:DnaJ-class molecular chaperone
MENLTLEEVTVYRRTDIACVLCKGKGNAILVNEDDSQFWKHPRPCPVCRGTGQHRADSVPSLEKITHMMVNYSSYK